MSAPNTPSKKHQNEKGAIAFPDSFKIVKTVVRSDFGSDITSGVYSYYGMEYIADKAAHTILGWMGWRDMDQNDRERLSLHWVDRVLHPQGGILFTKGDDKQKFSGFLSLWFKPTFSKPVVVSGKDGSVTITYWEHSTNNNNYNKHRVVFDTNGEIVQRTILNSTNRQFNFGLKLSFGILVLGFASFVVLKKKLPLLRK
ncbi:putative transmembrane protein [Cavenderia fasciculata]|uniref:Transmembrane protein n=1 Tax=Cavenderia fasciculata TaxID=261658 RepID=F4PTG4_CACFS|nr:putative transmembrane protein [Cavenderia fasciculata]EGG21686.1 putative transmembrane protein [Cavenderia fasciculata]|eukprot:XP_004359536.1 putative transmembrane protein [Cavenderia fasciculata]